MRCLSVCLSSQRGQMTDDLKRIQVHNVFLRAKRAEKPKKKKNQLALQRDR